MYYNVGRAWLDEASAARLDFIRHVCISLYKAPRIEGMRKVEKIMEKIAFYSSHAVLCCAALSALLLVACQSPAFDSKNVPVYNGVSGRASSWAALLAAIEPADVVLVGEQHTDATAHEIQIRLLREVLKQQPRSALSLEFLERDEQPIIERYRSGTLSKAEFISETRSENAAGTNTWIRWYQPLVDAAVAVHAPVYGANSPRYLARLARDKGYDFLNALPIQEQPYFSLPITQPTKREQKRFLGEMQEASKVHGAGSHVSKAMVSQFMRGQELWNATMAQSIVNAHNAGAPKVIHIVGGFHIEEYGGLVRELKARAPQLKIVTLQLDPNPKAHIRGRADFVWRTTPSQHDAHATTEASIPKETTLPVISALGSPLYIHSIDLDPAKNTLRGRVRIQLTKTTTSVELRLNAGLSIQGIEATGAVVKGLETHRVKPDEKTTSESDYTVRLAPSSANPELVIWWEGTQFQDSAASEAAGQIHNLDMKATIAQDGVYLSDAWYPQLAQNNLARHEISLGRSKEIMFVASGQRDTTASLHTDREIWYSIYPIQEFVLVGGRHQVFTSTWKDKEISVYLKPDQAGNASGLEQAIRRYLDRYEPLLGHLPVKQYRIVDNFFSSGFAFPGFTLLSSAVVTMGPVSQNSHGYIDHEFVHTWWGCGVQVKKDGGNWCEALTSFCTNYYGFVLDHDAAGARKYLRDASNAFSKLTPAEDLPLASFGSRAEVSRIIGYNKGAVVFHMLQQQIGSDAFFKALRKISANYTGQAIDWAELRSAFESESGQNLEWFFEQWVDRSGACELDLKSAVWNISQRELTLAFEKPANFRAQVSFELQSGDTRSSICREVQVGQSKITIEGLERVPETIVLDPGYDILRRIKPQEIVPTLDATRRAKKIQVIIDPAEKDRWQAYLKLFSSKQKSGQYRQGGGSAPADIQFVGPGEKKSQRPESSILILGSAARGKAAKSLLRQLQSPVKILPTGFSVSGKRYMEPGDAIMATLRHPTLPGHGITFIFGNSADSLPKADLLPFYPNSIVVFHDGRPVYREDIETDRSIKVFSAAQ